MINHESNWRANFADLRRSISNAISSFLQGLDGKRIGSPYKVVCDESNNSSDDIEQNRLNVDIIVEQAFPREPFCYHFTCEDLEPGTESASIPHYVGLKHRTGVYRVFVSYDNKIIRYPEELIGGDLSYLTIKFLPDTDCRKYAVFICDSNRFQERPATMQINDQYYDNHLQQTFQFTGKGWAPATPTSH